MVMVWKSNLEEVEQEVIEEFGVKAEQTGGVPAMRRPPTSKKGKSAAKSSPGKSQAGATNNNIGDYSDMPSHQGEIERGVEGVGGSGEELS